MSDLDACIANAANSSTADAYAQLVQCITADSKANFDAALNDLKLGVNSFWLIYAGALVFFMQVGFAMLCAGSIRAKNAKNVLLWNLLDSCGGATAYWSTGFAFSFGGDDPSSAQKNFIGNTNFFTMQTTDYEFWFFQFAFACALSSIVAGAIAERAKMEAYLFYSVFLVGFVYPVVAHSLWSYNGFLSCFNMEPIWGSGAFDFAGSGAVHMCGGVAALVMVLILGPRKGRFYDEDGKPLSEPVNFAPHSVTLQFLGTFALWFGWYGFNPGGALQITSANRGETASLATINTTLSAAAGAISAMFFEHFVDYFKTGLNLWDTTATMNGCLTGLVAITAGCGSVWPWAAFTIGAVGGVLYSLGSKLLIKLRIDDAVDAVPVHLIGGMWGMVATGLFSPARLLDQAYPMLDGTARLHEGWFYAWGNGSGDYTVIGLQSLAVLWIIGWTGATMGVYIYALHILGLLRVDAADEDLGMDISIHKGAAYEIEVDTAKEKQIKKEDSV